MGIFYALRVCPSRRGIPGRDLRGPLGVQILMGDGLHDEAAWGGIWEGGPEGASKSPVGSDNGSANEDAVEEFLGLLRDHDPQRVVKSFTDEELRRYVAKQISVDQSFQFCMREKVQPLFLQPRYVVLLSPTEGIVVVTYGFVAESASDVAGDRPDTKHTPWIARLEMHVTNGTLTHTILPKAEYWTTTEFLAHDHATILRQKYFGGAGAAGS
eukprot:g7381.t1